MEGKETPESLEFESGNTEIMGERPLPLQTALQGI